MTNRKTNHPNVLPLTSWSWKWPLFKRLPLQNCVSIALLFILTTRSINRSLPYFTVIRIVRPQSRYSRWPDGQNASAGEWTVSANECCCDRINNETPLIIVELRPQKGFARLIAETDALSKTSPPKSLWGIHLLALILQPLYKMKRRVSKKSSKIKRNRKGFRLWQK
jgi:hypothetical protein